MQIPRLIAAALLATLITAATPVIGAPFTVYFTPHVHWISDFPFVPGTMLADTVTYTDARGEIDSESFFSVDPLAENPMPFPSNGGSHLLIFAGETISWSLEGWFDLTVPFWACPDSASPAQPCQRAPIIPIATLSSEHWGTLYASGPVFAFDDAPVQIGRWEVFSDEFFIPEPAVIALVGIGL